MGMNSLKKVDVKQVEESGGFALDFVGNEDCSFMNWKAWTGGQGRNTSNTVKNSKLIYK